MTQTQQNDPSITNANYIQAFRVDTAGNVTGYIRKFEDALTSSKQLKTAQAQASSSQAGQHAMAAWNVTPTGSKSPVLVELNRERGEILVSGNFSDIIALNRAVAASTGEDMSSAS